MTTTHVAAKPYVPALRFHVLTKFYDRLIAATMREAELKSRLVHQAKVGSEHTVLDVGVGTGTLSLLIKASAPGARVVGIDLDPEIIALAREKAEATGVQLALEQASATALPFADASFDRVVSSLVFHHLPPAAKAKAFSEIRRVLKPGGQFHLLDFGRAANALMRIAFLPVQGLDGFESTSDNVEGRLVHLMEQAGLKVVREVGHVNTIFGTVSLFRAEAAF